MTVASLENNSSCCNVDVLVKAGSRVESYEQRGITHLLRNSAYLVSVHEDANRVCVVCVCCVCVCVYVCVCV